MLVWTESFSVASSGPDSPYKQTIAGTTGSPVPENGGGRTGPDWSPTSASGSASTGGTYNVRIGGAEQDATIIVGVALRWNVTGSPGAERVLFKFRSDGNTTEHIWITVGTDRKARIYRGTTAGTLLATSALPIFPLIPAGTSLFFYLEAKVVLSDTVGVAELRVDESVVVTFSGDTKNAGTLTVLDCVEYTLTGGVEGFTMDDLYLCNGQGSANNSYLGAVRIVPLAPNGNGTTSQGVNDSGNSTNNYSHVNDNVAHLSYQPNPPQITPRGVTFVDLQNTGDKDTYAFQDITGVLATAASSLPVLGVIVWTEAAKTDTGTRNAKAIARLGGTEVDGTEMPLNNNLFLTQGTLYETKPGGGGWTVADVGAAEFGVKAT